MAGLKPVTKQTVAKAMPLVRALIERLRATMLADSDTDVDHEYLFIGTLGTIAIHGTDTVHYRAARDALIDLHGRYTERRVISRRHVEKLLTETLMRTLRPAYGGYSDLRPRFERRTRKELQRLAKELLLPHRRWQLVVEVSGFTKDILPMTIGRIRFVRGSKSVATQVATNIFDLQPGSPRIALKKRLAANASRQQSRVEVSEMFAKNAVAFAEVAAIDSAAAKEIGFSEVRRTIDVLNFFAPFFEHPVGPHRVHLAPEGRGARLRWAVYDPSTCAFSYNDEPPNEWSLCELRPTSRRAREIGLARMHQLLANETRSDLDDRIVTAAAWAGRARAERRREEAFLLFAIALEALVTKSSARSGVTERLKFRIAHLVHRKPAPRRTLANTMEQLYKIRSALVHAGASDELGDRDLKIIEHVVELALCTMLTRKPFVLMKNATAFDNWFDDRMYSGT